MIRLDEISTGLREVQDRITQTKHQQSVTLVVVTKTFPVEDIQTLYDLGVRDFGENRIEELELKAPALPKDVRWHFLGQIQGKKIRRICQYAHVIHSLDSLEHAQKFAHALQDLKRDLTFFLQVNLEKERDDRGGVGVNEIPDFLLNSPVEISGLMVVLPMNIQPSEGFKQVANAERNLQENGFPGVHFLSMGMSNDFESAIAEGATHIRVGSSILGSRPPLA